MPSTTGGAGSTAPVDARYWVDDEWGAVPDGWTLGEVAAVAADRYDRIYVFHRGPNPMLVFERDGTFVRSWGEGLFVLPHGLHIADDDTIFCTDAGGHCVMRFTLEGELLMTLGTPGVPSAFQSGDPFNRCTHTALTPDGDILVTDGYGNARVHRYSADGDYLGSWGRPGTGPGEFNLPHNICCDDEGRVYIADRESHRIQVFDVDGAFVTDWHDLHRPSALYMSPGADPVFYVGEVGPYLSSNRGWPNLGPRISMLSADGEVLGRIDSPITSDLPPGSFVSPHGFTVDSAGDLYLADVCLAGWPSLFPDEPVPPRLRGLKKFSQHPTGDDARVPVTWK